MTEEFEKEKAVAFASPLGIAFITFETHQMAKTVYDTFNGSSIFCCKPELPKSTLSFDSIGDPRAWSVRYAPPPDDMYWTELSGSRKYLLIKYVVVNIFLFIFLLLLSTPSNYLIISRVFLSNRIHSIKK